MVLPEGPDTFDTGWNAAIPWLYTTIKGWSVVDGPHLIATRRSPAGARRGWHCSRLRI